jgi:hypothetical protein
MIVTVSKPAKTDGGEWRYASVRSLPLGRITHYVSLVTHHSSWIWLIILTIATLLVYISSLNYPFFWVDPIDIGLARDRSVLQISRPRRAICTIGRLLSCWKSCRAARRATLRFHLVHILTHVINVWLMFALAKRLLQQTFATGIAALFFAWYPFSHQTVTWVISPQPQATLFMLLSAILYYDGRVNHQKSRLQPESSQTLAHQLKPRLQSIDKKIWLSVVMLALALPFQENAVSFGFVIAALEGLIAFTLEAQGGEGSAIPQRWTIVQRERLKNLKWYPLLHIAVCLGFAALWFIIPKDPDSTIVRFDQATGWYLLQGLIWPVAGAVGPWRVWFSALNNPAWAGDHRRAVTLIARPAIGVDAGVTILRRSGRRDGAGPGRPRAASAMWALRRAFCMWRPAARR